MRPVPAGLLDAAVEVTHQNPRAHGAPVHVGDPGAERSGPAGSQNRLLRLIGVAFSAALLGIVDLTRPDYGDPVELRPGDVPVFWACGVTSIEAILSSSEGPEPTGSDQQLCSHDHHCCLFGPFRTASGVQPLSGLHVPDRRPGRPVSRHRPTAGPALLPGFPQSPALQPGLQGDGREDPAAGADHRGRPG